MCASSGVAFHHGGLDVVDRNTVEKCYQQRQISVICCTSTLAVGVNLPCHFVIIKNTMSWQGGGLAEYADLEIMQMLGRAGRYISVVRLPHGTFILRNPLSLKTSIRHICCSCDNDSNGESETVRGDGVGTRGS